MSRAKRDDMVVISMGLAALLESVRQTETWWRIQGNAEALRRARELGHAVRETHHKFFGQADQGGDDITEALFIAEGLRDAAQQCREGQVAVQERLIAGAEVIERLCRLRGAQS